MTLNCEILFFGEVGDQEKLEFCNGETVRGLVKLTLAEKTLIKKLWLKVNGLASCKWVDSGNNTQYSGSETYINNIDVLIDNPTELTAGVHTFNFSIKLPINLPSSIEEDKGYIRYSALTIIKRPKHSDLKTYRKFNVIRTLDLNKIHPEKKAPAEIEKISKTGCFCCSKKSLILTVQLPSTAFISGQIVKISTNVINLTRSGVEFIEISFVKRIFYYSSSLGGKMKKKTSVIKSEFYRNPEAVGCRIGYVKNFEIPKVVPTENSCRTLNVSYEIQIATKLSEAAIRSTIKIPVIIGTINYSTLIKSPSCETPPPTYEESMSYSYENHTQTTL